MSRVIKFRAWEDKSQTMMPNVKILLIEENAAYPHSRSWMHNCMDWEEEDLIDNPIFMQFTGLKDKNMVEIFNADIFSDKWKAEVYQNDEGTFMVRFHNNPKVNKPRSLKKYLMDREIAGTSDRDCSVIGNIYQNPELLESVQK